MKKTMIELICKTCCCKLEEASEYLESEVQNLMELQEVNDLRYSDFELACSNLGLENDYIPYFINRLAFV
ncbi:hypothetical protein [Prevotella sp. HUN102]|uniref:Uncharacterized protein n=2 Tax=unclassified Prevotella TaxID=2638335 RepID=A0AB33JIN2_9BACT|nr:hypothetical protein [Prevotella sp. HUN102]